MKSCSQASHASARKHKPAPGRRWSYESTQLRGTKFNLKPGQDSDKENALIKEPAPRMLNSNLSYAAQCYDNYRGGANHYPYECPVEIQAQEPLLPEDREDAMQRMEHEFRAKRKILITGLPHDCIEEDLDSFFKEFSCIPVSKVKDGSVRVLFGTSAKAKDSITLINSTIFKCHKLSASYGHADSLLFVGNLPFTYTRDDLLSLFRPHGDILRCLLIHSPRTGLSKGYGFVEYATRDEAMLAKQQLATKVIGLRSLRVDFSDNGMQTCEDLHSQTLFVDRLPKGYKDDVALKEVFSRYGRVNFCQVATTPGTRLSRGFAFIDMSTSEEAEQAQVGCNGCTFFGQDIRVSFGMPCRHGACILQHKTSIPFKAAGKLTGTILHPLKCFPTTNLASQFPDLCNHGAITPSYSDSCLQVPCHYHHLAPLRELNAESTNSLQGNKVDSSPLNEIRGGICKSQSAPSILGSRASSQLKQQSACVHPTVYLDMPLHSQLNLTQTQCEDSHCSVLGKKRPLSVEANTNHGVYDKAFIGQHQQGIPFTHPLKRIRMEY